MIKILKIDHNTKMGSDTKNGSKYKKKEKKIGSKSKNGQKYVQIWIKIQK